MHRSRGDEHNPSPTAQVLSPDYKGASKGVPSRPISAAPFRPRNVGALSAIPCHLRDGRYRHLSLIAAGSGDGLLSDHLPDNELRWSRNGPVTRGQAAAAGCRHVLLLPTCSAACPAVSRSSACRNEPSAIATPLPRSIALRTSAGRSARGAFDCNTSSTRRAFVPRGERYSPCLRGRGAPEVRVCVAAALRAGDVPAYRDRRFGIAAATSLAGVVFAANSPIVRMAAWYPATKLWRRIASICACN